MIKYANLNLKDLFFLETKKVETTFTSFAEVLRTLTEKRHRTTVEYYNADIL